MWLYFVYFQTILNRQDRWYHKWTLAIVTKMCVLYIVCIYWCHFCKFNLYLYDLSSITSTLVQIRPLFVYICHYHYYKPTVLYISELINVFIYFVTYRPIWPGAFCVFVYVIIYNCVNVCTSHNNTPFTTYYYIANLTEIGIVRNTWKLTTADRTLLFGSIGDLTTCFMTIPPDTHVF